MEVNEAKPEQQPDAQKSGNGIISLIVPTRNRPENILRFSQSLRANTADCSRVELVLVIDDDDRSYDGISFEGLWITKMITPHGSAMGELNRAGYGVCLGDYIMLLNDDVLIETPGWDQIVLDIFHAHPDNVVLVHVNDGIFHDKLCTFPFLTRRFCELAGGICPADYRRYRIDDHIYNVFNLLSVLGHNRIVYLPDVEFRHLNFVTDDLGKIEYQPDPNIHEADTDIFHAAFPERKALALKLVEVIDEYRRQQVQQIRGLVLEPISDSVALRRPEYVRTLSSSSQLSSAQVRVTIGVVSADIYSKHASECLQAIKAHTSNFDLVVLDNNRGPNFNHPREMNSILSVCRNGYLVLMDDDVIVEPGWLNGLLSCITPHVGVVTPLHKSADGKLSYAGVVMRPDYSGHHTHAFALYSHAFPTQTLCSAILLIDMNKCGQIRFDESYSKYFLDLDYGLRVWESGFQVVCSPEVSVTHIGGATLDRASEKLTTLFEEQRRHFVRCWIDTGRYQALERSLQWRNAPEIDVIQDIPRKLSLFLQEVPDPDPNRVLAEARDFFDHLDQFPAVKYWVRDQVWAQLRDRKPDFSRAEGRKYAALAGLLVGEDNALQPVLVEQGYKGFNLIRFDRIYGLAQSDGAFDAMRAAHGGYRLHGETVEAVKKAIDALQPILVEENYKGFNLVLFDRIYGLALGDGAFDPKSATRGRYPLHGLTAEAVRAQIDKAGSPDKYRRRISSRVRSILARRWAAHDPATRIVEDHNGFNALQPVLVEQGYKGFNLVRFDRIYGLAQSDGAFDATRAARGGYPLHGETAEAVKTIIDALQPILVEENYKGFNLVQFDRIYGLALAEGAFDPKSAARGRYPLHGLTAAAVRAQIDKVSTLGRYLQRISRRVRSILARRRSPAATKNMTGRQRESEPQGNSSRWVALDPARRIVEDYNGFAISRFEYKFFATPRSKGPFSYQAYRRNEYGPCPIGHSVEEVKKIIDRQAGTGSASPTRLIFASLADDKMKRLLPATDYATKDWLLVGRDQEVGIGDERRIVMEYPTVMDWAADVAAGKLAEPGAFVDQKGFDTVVIPWAYPETWRNYSLELSASRIANHIEIVTETAAKRSYHGETVHRLLYNKAYLSSMLEVIPFRESMNVLEVGCSDGLVCDIMGLLGASKVTGVDVMTTVGCAFQGTNGEFLTMDATDLQFKDESFGLVYSIATLEHVADPYKAIDEMIRTLRVGGYGYVQAAPLYYSPFGHHMFSYFADYPWVHLRLTKEEIVARLKQQGMDDDLLRNFGVSPETYVQEMLNPDHLNGLTLDKYRLEEIRRRADIEILKFDPSFEGENLLTPSIFDQIRKRTPDIGERNLVEHGFQLAFRRKS